MFAGRGRSPWRWSLWKEGKGRAIDAVASWRPQAAHPGDVSFKRQFAPQRRPLHLVSNHRALSSPPDENPLRRQSCALLSRRWALRSGRVLHQEVAWIVTVSRTRRNQRRTLVKESRSAHSGLAGSPAPPLPSAFPREQVGTALPKVPAQGVRAQNRRPRGGHSTHSLSPLALWPCRHRAWHRAHRANGSPAGKTARTSRCTGSRVGMYHPHGSSQWRLQAGLRGRGRGGEKLCTPHGRSAS